MSSRAREDEAAELRRCLRDVLGLLALPAAWQTRAPREILVSFVEALESTLAADVVLGQAFSDRGGISVAHVRGVAADDRLEEVRGWFAPLASRTSSALMRLPCGHLGELTAVFEPLGFQAARGSVIVACSRESFPSRTEVALIRAATALATTAVETSRALLDGELAARAKDEFLAVLAHELRSPLAPIVSALEVLRKRGGGKLGREVEVIDRQVKHLGHLVDDLLDIARISRGTLQIATRPVELSRVVTDAVEATESIVAGRRLALRMDVPSEGLVVDVDPFRLCQVFVNLITNATKYSREGGAITIEADAREEKVVIAVADEGIGIPPDLVARIFDPFVQGRRAADAQYGGLGIGLALVRTFITMFGGTVTAESAGPGRGSRFEITLPLSPLADVPDRSRPPIEPASAARALRVLVVDDHLDAGEMLGEALAAAGHDVRVTNDPLRAAEAADALRAEVVVLDIGMPGLDGYAVAETIRRRMGSRPPVFVALTGFGQAKDRERSAAAGFRAHFVKPVDMTELMAILRDLQS